MFETVKIIVTIVMCIVLWVGMSGLERGANH